MRGTPVIVAVVVTATALLGGCDEAPIVSRGDIRGDQRGYEVSRRVDRVVVDTTAGSVRVRGTNEDKPPAVTEELHYEVHKPQTRHEIDGDTLVLTATCPRRDQRHCWVDYTVTVEDAVELVVRTGAGDVVMADLTGAVEASTGAGDIRARALGGSSASARSSAGGVELEFTSQPQTVDATTSAGDVSVKLPSGTYAVDAATEVGDRTVGVPVDSRSAHRVRARTEVGDVSVVGRG